tara:strand:- start:3929 stop:5065 length:1137 start_codon:yes stop_codon:yes gene_type:complete
MEIYYFDNAWQIFTAFSVLIAGFLIFTSQPFHSVSRKLSLLLYCWHTLFCLYYAYFALYNAADSSGYFRRSLRSEVAPAIGTPGVDFFTSVFSQFLGLSYIGTFLVFNIIGAFGVLAILAAFRETTQEKSKKIRAISIIICFLPGINFWTAAIGKDAISMLGTGLICWAAIDIRKRWLMILISALCYILVRPHVVPVVVLVLLFSMLISGKMSSARKILMVAVLAVPSIFAVQFAMSFIGLDATSQFDGVGAFIEYRQSVNMQNGSSVDISSMILPVQMFYYAFMPLFIGAGGLMGLIASIENAFLTVIVVMSIPHIIRKPPTIQPQVRLMYLLFALVLWVIFAMTTANTGLALRQKWMFMPMLLLFCIAYLPARRIR